MPSQTRSNRSKLYIEVLRVFACLFVIFNHMKEFGFELYALREPGTLPYWIYMGLSVFCKFAVPLFFMVSGMLLLNKEEESLKDIYIKRVAPICITWISMSMVSYLVRYCLLGTSVFSLKEFITILYSRGFSDANWFFYTYIAFLILLPFLRIVAQKMSNKLYIYLFVIFITFYAILPIMEYLLWEGKVSLNANISIIQIPSIWFIYSLFGYYLEHRLDIQVATKKLPLIWGLNLLTIGISCVMSYYRGICQGIWKSEHFFSLLTIFNASCLFITCKVLLQNRTFSPRVQSIISIMGKSTFGVYVFHGLINDYIIRDILVRLNQSGLSNIIVGFIGVTSVYTISLLVTIVVSKIPILKKVVGY